MKAETTATTQMETGAAQLELSKLDGFAQATQASALIEATEPSQALRHVMTAIPPAVMAAAAYELLKLVGLETELPLYDKNAETGEKKGLKLVMTEILYQEMGDLHELLKVTGLETLLILQFEYLTAVMDLTMQEKSVMTETGPVEMAAQQHALLKIFIFERILSQVYVSILVVMER